MIVKGDNRTIEQLMKQLHKLVNILNVQNVTHVPCVERELMLIKINTNPRDRGDVLNIANIFRAKVVDVAVSYLTLEVTGDPGKIFAIQKLLSNYQVVEIIRTGKIALIRESNISTEALKRDINYSDDITCG